MDSKGFDLAIADANRLTLHVLATAEHERHMIGERVEGRLGGSSSEAEAPTGTANLHRKPSTHHFGAAMPRALRSKALRPHIERCIEAGRTSSNAIATDTQIESCQHPARHRARRQH